MLKSPSPHGCYFCKVLGLNVSKGKTVYPGIWRWLETGHARRTAKAASTNFCSMKQARERTRRQVLTLPPTNTHAPQPRNVTDVRPDSKALRDTGKQAALDMAASCVLWQLPYWWMLGHTVLSSYDGMHTIGGDMKDLVRALAGERFDAAIQAYEALVNKR